MDDKPPAKRPRPLDMGGRPSAPAPAARSGVLDLRPAPGGPPRPIPANRPPAPSRSIASSPLESPAPKPPATAPPGRRAEPLQPAATPSTDTDASLQPRRFWPAFWRFLVLLIVFGVLVTGGLYLYLTVIKK